MKFPAAPAIAAQIISIRGWIREEKRGFFESINKRFLT